jgi:hypothetical protein
MFTVMAANTATDEWYEREKREAKRDATSRWAYLLSVEHRVGGRELWERR